MAAKTIAALAAIGAVAVACAYQPRKARKRVRVPVAGQTAEPTDLPPEFYKADAGVPEAPEWKFYCAWKQTGRVGPDGHCGYSYDECRQYSAFAADKGSTYGPCEGASAAACYSSVMVIYGRRTQYCFPSMSTCKDRREWTMKELSDDFTDFDECRPVR